MTAALRNLAAGRWRDSAVRAGTVRLLTMPLTTAASFATTAIVVSRVGSLSYGYVALIATIGALIPFADLGLGAAIQSVTAGADSASSDAHVERVLVSSLRLLVASGVLVAASGIAIGGTVGWAPILGLPRHGTVRVDLVVPIVLLIFATGLPAGIGQRILIGLERNDIAVALAALAPVIGLGAVAALAETGATAGVYAIVQPAALLASTGITAAVAARLSGVSPMRIVRLGLRVRAYRGAPVLASAWPMLVIMIGLPIALQSDRVILAHRSTPLSLSKYAIAAQIYASAWSVVYAAGVTLWPRFARERARGVRSRDGWSRAVKAFTAGGLAIGLGLGALMPSLVHVLSRGMIIAPVSLAGAFAALLVIQSIHLPSAMLLTTPKLLQFQACCVLGMVVVNLGVSWVLAARIGAAGPVIGSAVSIGAVQLIPTWLAARRFVSATTAAVRAPIVGSATEA